MNSDTPQFESRRVRLTSTYQELSYASSRYGCEKHRRTYSPPCFGGTQQYLASAPAILATPCAQEEQQPEPVSCFSR